MSALDPPFGRIAICGVGLIGGSLGLAIKSRWPAIQVTAIDRPEVVAAAVELAAADCGQDAVAGAAGADLVVLAAPVGVNTALLRQLQTLGTGALITDTGSTKRDIVRAVASGGAPVRFVGGHPIAGAATPGIRAARSDLFAGRPWILTPGSDGSVPSALRDLLEGVGARVHVMTPEAHDRLLSAVSHLPQLASSALMHVVGESAGEAGLACAGPGLRDTTRLAASPPDVWRDIAAANRDYLSRDLDALIAALADLRRGLADGTDTALDRTFDSAARWKRALERHFDKA
jgi:prephenate dehydrogenase